MNQISHSVKLAVIESGGNQFLVKEGDRIKVKRIRNHQVKDEVVFDKVLLYVDGQNILIGQPYLANINVKGEIIKEIKEKIVVGKFKPKTRYHKKIGTKLYWHQVLIKKIEI